MVDPIALGILVEQLAPALGVLACAALPIGILWINKNHKLRMRELELEAQALDRATGARIAAMENRIGSLELSLSQTRALTERTGVFEAAGEPTSPLPLLRDR
jgi:hypothetical protein